MAGTAAPARGLAAGVVIWLLLLGCGSDPIVADADGDGHRAPADCDDADPDVHPDAVEVCDALGRDEDCDGRVNEPGAKGEARGWFDEDGDGWGARAGADCSGSRIVSRAGDCDDADRAVSPGATEICDPEARDEDCDGNGRWFHDADGDAYGGDHSVTCAGAVARGGDCDDADPAVSPAALEICGDGFDGDCDENAMPCAFEGEIGPVEAVGWLPGLPIATADIDRDGVTDLVTRLSIDGGARVQVFFGPLASDAAPDLAIEVAGVVTTAVLLDLDGDGNLDLAVDQPHGDGTWAADVEVRYGPLGRRGSARWAVGGPLAGLAAAGDTDGDGRDELLVRSGDVTWLIQGRPSGATVAEVAHVEVAAAAAPVGDVDGDGLEDLGLFGMPSPCSFAVVLAPHGPDVAASDAFACRDTEDAEAVGAWPVGDLDGDGLDDLVVTSARTMRSEDGEPWIERYGHVLYGGRLGEGALDGEPLYASGAHMLGDLDGDGLDDLLTYAEGACGTASCRGGEAVLAGSTGVRSRFAVPGAELPTPFGAWALPAADYDGDGRIDLLLGDPDVNADGTSGRTGWFSATGEGW